MRKILQICLFVAWFLVFTVISPLQTYALTSSQLEMFSQNNIFAYDPSGSACYTGNLAGNTVMAKIVSYLKGNNPTGFVLSNEGIAGILANFEGESGFNPFRFEGDSVEGPGYGIAQFTPMSKILEPLRSDPRTSSYYNTYFDIKYTRFDSETGLPKEPVPDEVVNAWLTVQMDFFFGASSEFENTKVGDYRNKGGVMGLDYINSSLNVHEAMNSARTPEDATRIFVWIMERPGDKAGASERRGRNAQKWFEYARAISGSAAGAGGSSSSTSKGSDVTIIGDSITVGSESEIRDILPQAEIYAQESKQFYNGTSDNPSGVTILKELLASNKLRNNVIFALGTNSNGVTKAQIDEVIELVGSSRKVVFVTNYTTANDYIGNNNNFVKAKNENKNVLIADWKAAIESHPTDYLANDGIHPNAEGRALFASIITKVIDSSNNTRTICGGAIDGGLSKTQAQRLADYYNGPNAVVNWGTYRKKNCVAFSWWFVTNFTDLKWGSGNGKDVAHATAIANGLEEGNEPRPFALFSVTRGSVMCGNFICGHTGIVVNVNGDKITVVEAGYGRYAGIVVEYNLSYFVNTQYGYTFTYLDSVLDQDKLSSAIGA